MACAAASMPWEVVRAENFLIGGRSGCVDRAIPNSHNVNSSVSVEMFGPFVPFLTPQQFSEEVRMLKLAHKVAETLLFFPDRKKTFFDAQSFPWVPNVEAEWKIVRKELDNLLIRREDIPNFQD